MAFGRRRKAPQEQDTGFSQQAGAEPQRIRLTPVDVQQKVFRLAFRGYNEQDVDHFLDEITEDLAALHEENKRLREELELRGPGGGTEDARRHAEEIIRRAREEAARISAAAPVVSVGSVAATPAFLVREREFLQRLASLVQDHAASLKSEARRAREAVELEEPEQEELEELEPDEPEPEPEQEELEPEEPAQPLPDLGHTAPMPPPQGGGFERSSNPFEGPETEEGEEILDDEEAAPGGEEEPSLRELFWGEE